MITVISVRFRSGSKTYYFDPKNTLVRTGDDVIVETSQGQEFARCVEGNHHVTDDQIVSPLRGIIRIATDNDRRTNEYNRKREADAFQICQKKIAAHKLEMKLVRVECSFDGSKILFFFTADGRVDFRELVKDLASVFRSRIELRQIGVRDEAKMLGGLGICGRPFCCSQFMDDFMPVSIKMAKTQNLSLNPTKISGTCGRLMCCLKYEQAAYEDALKRLPKNDSFVMTPDGPGNVTDVNILKEKVTVRLDEHTECPNQYHNCEVCVLRNGKGSRDGIEIPDQRPERFVEEKEEELPIPVLFSDFEPEANTSHEDSGEKRRSSQSRRRGRRSGKAGDNSKGSENKTGENKNNENKSSDNKGSAKKQPKADAKPGKSDNGKPGEGKGSNRSNSNRRRRKPGSRGEGSASKPNAPKAPQAPAAKPRNEGAPKAAGTAPRKRPHRRGGRRHSGGGSNSNPPKAEN